MPADNSCSATIRPSGVSMMVTAFGSTWVRVGPASASPDCSATIPACADRSGSDGHSQDLQLVGVETLSWPGTPPAPRRLVAFSCSASTSKRDRSQRRRFVGPAQALDLGADHSVRRALGGRRPGPGDADQLFGSLDDHPPLGEPGQQCAGERPPVVRGTDVDHQGNVAPRQHRQPLDDIVVDRAGLIDDAGGAQVRGHRVSQRRIPRLDARPNGAQPQFRGEGFDSGEYLQYPQAIDGGG